MDGALDFLSEHWPWFTVMTTLWVLGHYVETSVFTKERALRSNAYRKLRESMELHPIVSGAIVGLIWQDPLDAEWGWQKSVAYFLSAGVASMFGWKIIVWLFGRVGVDLSGVTLPGESSPPESES